MQSRIRRGGLWRECWCRGEHNPKRLVPKTGYTREQQVGVLPSVATRGHWLPRLEQQATLSQGLPLASQGQSIYCSPQTQEPMLSQGRDRVSLQNIFHPPAWEAGSWHLSRPWATIPSLCLYHIDIGSTQEMGKWQNVSGYL